MNRCMKSVVFFGILSILLGINQLPSFSAELERQEFFINTDTGMKIMVVAKIPKSGRMGKAVLLVHGSGVGWPYWDIPIRDYYYYVK